MIKDAGICLAAVCAVPFALLSGGGGTRSVAGGTGSTSSCVAVGELGWLRMQPTQAFSCSLLQQHDRNKGCAVS